MDELSEYTIPMIVIAMFNMVLVGVVRRLWGSKYSMARTKLAMLDVSEGHMEPGRSQCETNALQPIPLYSYKDLRTQTLDK